MVTVSPGMQDLQTDLATFLVHRLGDGQVLSSLGGTRQTKRKGGNPAGPVRRHSAGHDKSHAAPGA
ncbi:MAG: hypothetical protein ACD_75C01856G0001, partial [uncultured bacterium]